ncbi:MAG TPA: leucine-rich repeat domain-containing protein [Polyangiaceae bacterium]|nr:leucine-rich repeat domain-containing protein [Polyangiaceae bacterium]
MSSLASNPQLGARQCYAARMRVGRPGVMSETNTKTRGRSLFSARTRLGCAAVALALTSACESEPTSTANTGASASATKPSSMVIPVEEKPVEQKAPEPEKPKKKLEDCATGNTLTIDDPALEQGIRFKLQKMTGTLTKADLGRLASLNLSQAKVNELDVCVFPHMTSLKELFLGPGDLDDLSPIAGLKNLETLGASINKVSDLSPLSGLSKLDRLDLGRTQVKDLSPLSGLTRLTELMLDSTPVEDLTPLSGMKDLEKLSINKTQVKDVRPLAGLKKLKFLYAADTPADEDPMSFAPIRANGTKVINL